MEAEAALHVTAADPGLRVALPWRPARTGGAGGAARPPARPGDDRGRAAGPLAARRRRALGPALRRPARAQPDRGGAAERRRARRLGRDDGAARPGAARLHPTRGRSARCCGTSSTRSPPGRCSTTSATGASATLVGARARRVRAQVSPVWPRLRAQVAHTDLSVDNTLTDDAGFITGIIDFGDMSHTALVTELASVLDSLGVGREGDELFRLARLVLDGYQRRIELEELELEVLGVMWAARSAVTIAISSWRVAPGAGGAGLRRALQRRVRADAETMQDAGLGRGGPPARRRRWPGRAAGALAGAAARGAFGPAMEALFYDVPVEVAARRAACGSPTPTGGATSTSTTTCPCVGPRPPARDRRHRPPGRGGSTRTCATCTRPRSSWPSGWSALCPPELDTVLLVNSGSEANDLAWRMATAVTGRRGRALHRLRLPRDHRGDGGALARVVARRRGARARRDAGSRPTPIAASTSTAPGSRRRSSGSARRGLAPAAAILDGLVMSDRIDDLDPAYVQDLVRQTRDAGALWIADEVQAGHGRTGERCGRLTGSASSRTSSRWASRWATATRSPPS